MRYKPKFMIVTVQSDDGVSVDLKIKLLRGAGFKVELGSGEGPTDSQFRISGLPVRDQRCWIAGPRGTFTPWNEEEETPC